MKYLLIFVLSLFISHSILAQEIEKIIVQNDVERIIKKLSSDEMRGRSAMKPEDIGKATAFIESEFKAIGLQNLKDLKSFRQEFEKTKIEKISSEVVIDGEKILPDNFIFVSNNDETVWNSDVTVKVLEKDKDFFKEFRSLRNGADSKIVLVAPEYQKQFQRVQGLYNQTRLLDANTEKMGTTLFVLGRKTATHFSVTIRQKKAPLVMTNVVGMLEGRSKKNEMVIFAGHYDHLGIISPVNGDSIANGADDDASGTTAVIELARYFKKLNNNERTLIFVAFTAEEIGGFGSQYFSKQLDADKVVAMFNIEMIGKPSKWGENSAFITGFERSDFGTILQKNLKGTKFEFHPDPYPEQNLFYRSDNTTLARLGVPAHSISTDQIDSDKLYHTVKDEFSSLNMSNVTTTIRFIALSSVTLVNGKDTPKRIDIPGNK